VPAQSKGIKVANEASVDLGGMQQAQSAFQDALDHASSAFSQMDGQIEGLQASWTGQAAQIFQNAMQQWLEDLSRVNSSLSTMLETLHNNTGVYANTHADTQQQANSVRQQISSGSMGLPGFPS
jgi:WXG100 family type VII secretion target